MPFKSGAAWNGNRKGRPRNGQTVAEKVRQLGGEDGAVYLQVLHSIATDPTGRTADRMTACGLLLERGHGKPAQEIDLRTPDGVQVDGPPLPDVVKRLAVLATALEQT